MQRFGAVLEMENGQDRVLLEDPPTSFRSAGWQHYGFSVTYNIDGEKVVDNTMSVCKCSATRMANARGNISNMMAHWRRHHFSMSARSTRRRETGGKEQLHFPATFKTAPPCSFGLGKIHN